jgi:hypothetical protein
VLGELDHRAGGPVGRARRREHERLDVAFEERSDAHGTRLEGGEDRRVGEPARAELSCGFAEGDDDGMRRRVARFLDSIVGPRHHRLVDDGHGRAGALPPGQRGPRLRERLAHEQFVVHEAIIPPARTPTTQPICNCRSGADARYDHLP